MTTSLKCDNPNKKAHYFQEEQRHYTVTVEGVVSWGELTLLHFCSTECLREFTEDRYHAELRERGGEADG